MGTRCHLCVRIFSTKANLSSHIRHVHMGEAKHSRVKSIPCPHCQKMFSRKGHMTEHVRTVHEGKKRIYKEVNCQHCGKTFRKSGVSTFTYHLLMQTLSRLSSSNKLAL